jgi:hypothetical protein
MTGQEDKHRFFGREHLIRAGWVVLLGFAGFIGAAIYHSFVTPQKFVIDNQRQQPIPVIVKEASHETQPSYAPEIQSLTAELKLLRDAYDRQAKEVRKPAPSPGRSTSPSTDAALSRPPTAPVMPDVRELADEVRRLRDALAKEKTPEATQVPKASRDELSYRLPPMVKGYRPVSFLGINGSICPPKELKPSDPISISFNVVDRSLLSRATPLFTRIIQKRDKENLLQVFDHLNELQDGHNQLSFTTELAPANYYIEFGYYLRTKLDEEFPEYYSHKCEFQIKA